MKLRDLLELCRVSNLPTVWSNAVVGSLAGYIAWLHKDSPNHETHVPYLLSNPNYLIAIPLVPALMLSMIYCAGMVLNDYWDREIDAKERPGRPIPSGRVSERAARNLVFWLIFLGLFAPIVHAFATFISVHHSESLFSKFAGFPILGSTLALVLLIITYNRVHAGHPAAVVLMALCRVFAVITAGLVYAPFPTTWYWWIYVAGPALTVGIYTLAISLVARREMDRAAQPRRFGGPKTIMNMIAAMPLLDAAWLLVMGLWPASLFCVACAGLTKLGHRKVAGS